VAGILNNLKLFWGLPYIGLLKIDKPLLIVWHNGSSRTYQEGKLESIISEYVDVCEYTI
jgi:hypothetical protein